MNDPTRQTNFVLQQGLEAPAAASCTAAYAGLLFQPRLIGVVVVIASLMQSATTFAVLGAMLWWSAAFPRWNSYVFHLLTGQKAFANRTLPWSRPA